MSEAGREKDNEQEAADKKEDVQYKYRKKNLMKRIIITCILILTAGLCLAPVLFLLVGTFMGNHEIYTCIAPALGKGDGLAIWHLLPQYPTLQNVVELLFDSPEYFQMFWNSIFYTGAILAGQMLFWHAGSVGAGAVFFPRKKNSLPAVHSRDDDAVSGHDVVAVSGVKPSGNAGQTAGSRFARNFCNVFRLYYVPLFPWNTGKCHGGGTYGRGGEFQIFLRIGIPLGSPGILSALVFSFLDCFSMLEQPMTFFENKKSLAVVTFSAGDHEPERRIFTLCITGDDPARDVCFSGRTDYLEQGIAMAGAKE